MEALEAELSELKRDRSAMQGNLAEEIDMLKKQIREQEFSQQEQIRLLKADH